MMEEKTKRTTTTSGTTAAERTEGSWFGVSSWSQEFFFARRWRAFFLFPCSHCPSLRFGVGESA
jgi:hypothetical protein